MTNPILLKHEKIEYEEEDEPGEYVRIRRKKPMSIMKPRLNQK